jgi:hypothetical protein
MDALPFLTIRKPTKEELDTEEELDSKTIPTLSMLQRCHGIHQSTTMTLSLSSWLQ